MEDFRSDFLSHERVYDESSLLSRWRFNESVQIGNETLIKDVGVARNDGFLVGGAQLLPGKFGNSLVLDGSGII